MIERTGTSTEHRAKKVDAGFRHDAKPDFPPLSGSPGATMLPRWTAVNEDETVSLMDQTPPKVIAPRQPRAVETRQRLLDAVEALAAAEGPAAVTTTRLAVETGVSVGTIYRYFEGREALLLAAYDATVERIVARCAVILGALPADLAPAQAAGALLSAYLSSAEAIPAHSGLLAAMRSIRPIEADQLGGSQAGILRDLFLPFFARYLPGAEALDPTRLSFISVTIGTMVDLYLVADAAARPALRAEIEAHVGLMAERISPAAGGTI